MFMQLTTLNPLIGNGMLLDKKEVIKRYRSLKTANYFVLQLLSMIPFACIGKDEKGDLYYY